MTSCPRVLAVRKLFVFLIFLTYVSVPSSLAHICDTNQLHLVAGDACPWRITADRVETTTTYTPILSGPGGVTGIAPARPFQSHHGDFIIRGLAPGTNQLSVVWFYPGTGAGGVCSVTIVVTPPVPGQLSFQTSQGDGQLCTAEFGKYIEARTLRGLLDFYVPAATPKLLVLTECFGGNIAQSPYFVSLTNTAIASATSPNQEARTGGYPDDAARALKPQVNLTAAEVHHAGTVGRQTVESIDNPQHDKQTAFMLSEWPTTAGGLSLGAFRLDPVSTNGPIESRHIVVYCGNPIARMVRVETHAGATIPSVDGEKAAFGDALDRDNIKQSFAPEPNTTVTTAGGAPPGDDRRLGQDGWDFSGTLPGLEAALQSAGAAIRSSLHPEREQFILYVGDHGLMGTLGNAPREARPSTPNSRSELAPAFETFVSGDPAVQFMEQDPNNVPGFLLALEFGQTPAPFPTFQSGALALECQAAGENPVVLGDFVAQPVDLDGDGQVGTRDGEGVSLFFPVNEQTFLTQWIDRSIQIVLINHSPYAFAVTKIEQVTGSIERGWTPGLRPKLLGPAPFAKDGFEFVLRGTVGKSYVIESSVDHRIWREVTTFTLNSSTKAFRDPSPLPSFQYYRARLVE